MREIPFPPIIHWAARLLSLLSLGIVGLFMVGGDFQPWRFPLHELVMSLFFPIGVCLGMILAWRWEGLGGFVTVLSLALFYIDHVLVAHRIPHGPWFLIFASPGFLFLLSWWLRRKQPTMQGT